MSGLRFFPGEGVRERFGLVSGPFPGRGWEEGNGVGSAFWSGTLWDRT